MSRVAVPKVSGALKQLERPLHLALAGEHHAEFVHRCSVTRVSQTRECFAYFLAATRCDQLIGSSAERGFCEQLAARRRRSGSQPLRDMPDRCMRQRRNSTQPQWIACLGQLERPVDCTLVLSTLEQEPHRPGK